ncbi:ricin-type beta-trefoil lectin domain protein [Dactylosporangium salmoneum]|uniref:CBM6 domain-containing protein n=1 Tax=Dactylosporangium salmoneum TaxID=53361 RepID=A0ABP5SLZ5_9ACTN
MFRRMLPFASAAALVAGTVVALAAPARAATDAVIDGSARFEVLTPTLIRMEYAGDGAFQDATTFNAVNRNFPVPSYTTAVTADGYREIRTSALTLRYKQGSGPFTAANVSVALSTGVTAAPAFPSYCAFGTACEAENALLTGFAAPAYDHTGYTGSAFVAGYEKTGSGLAIDVSGVPSAGSYKLQVRYSNAKGATGTLSTRVNSTAGPALSLPQTANWNTWATTSVTVSVPAGTSTISLLQNASDTGQVNIDSIALTPTSTTTYPAASTALVSTGYGAGPADTLGGWSRSLDNPAVLPVPEHPGILTRSGWYLLDDSRTALLSASHVVTDRPSHGSQPYQDGYFFGYGQNYKQGLGDLNALTGNTALLPQSAYGVWYSRYFAYSAADYQNTLIPTFRSTFTPIDWLVIDTDWKSPSQWNGWNWNTGLFPDPTSFMNWTKQQGLNVSLNIHTSIAGNDPRFATANSQAGGLIPDGGNYAFDWSNPNHMTAYMNLHKPFEQQGVRTWWLDYCTGCGASTASDPHVSPDTLINQAYADSAAARGLRPFSFGRIGGSEMGNDDSNFAIGPWPERRDTMQFTGDTPATWDMLAFEARFAGDEAAAGLSNVSHDIGSFHGGHLADDMYVRWVQLGTFQPIDRLHSDHGDRLPWNYTGAAASAADAFLRLREALVPYTYTLAAQARSTGVPIVRPLYLNYPANNEAYTNPTEYLYGDNVLVAPIVSSSGSRSVWIPPGTWTDYFTGQAYTGPSTATISDPLSQMPVLIKAGGIMPTRTDYVDYAAQRPLTQLTVNVTAGADGSFSLYSDAGEGTSTASTNAPLTWTDSSRTLSIGAQTGSFTGAPTTRAYTLRLSNASAPTAVTVDGVQLPETAWSYNGNSHTVTVTTSSLSLSSAHTVSLTGSGAGNPAGGEVLGIGGLCLDVRGGASADGTALQVYGCNHSTAQTFAYGSDNTVRVLGKCLTAGAGVTISTCSGAATQQWTHQSNGALVSGGQCLDVPNSNTTPGAVQLQMYACNGTGAQTWKLPPGQLTGPGGLCADVANGSPASGTAVQLWGCNGTDAQRWSAPGDQTIRTLGKCLDVANAGSANGTPVQLWDCDGTGAQTWQTRSDGTLYNPQSGRCLDDPNNNQHNGDLLQIWDCNTTTAQKFRLG